VTDEVPVTGSNSAPPDSDPRFEDLLRYLRDNRGFDFTGYKRATLRRRVTRRMAELGLDGVAAYLDYLEVHPDEFPHLFNTILINVTSFFRDPEHWDFVASRLLPQLLAERAPHEPIRIWSAGCASGEEAYTIAILLAEQLGPDAFRERVKIYATDVDEDALSQARHAAYDADALEAVPPEFRDRYFDPYGHRFQFRGDLRRAVVFGRHDIVQDAPIGRIDLMLVRNLLMYFNRQTQAQVLANLHFGLTPHGYLVLGKAEMLLSRNQLFEPVDLPHRVFRRVPDAEDTARAQAAAPRPRQTNELAFGNGRLRDAAFAASPIAQIVLDPNGTLVLANAPARILFGLGRGDIGRQLKDLELSYRPIELRSRIDQALKEQRNLHLRNVERLLPGQETQYLDIAVTPLKSSEETVIGIAVTFDDVTRYEQLRDRLQSMNEELETAYEELQSTNEELETTNEELQSTVEELETTNEELQSSNEELETMNEELQSTNAEQHEVNQALAVQTAELKRAHSYLDSILSSLSVAVVVVDHDLRVELWNDRAFDLWGLREDEVVGTALPDLDIGLPVTELEEAVRRCVRSSAGRAELALPARTRRGRDVRCTIDVARLADPIRPPGAVLLMEAEEVAADG
jgi:two-component system, chemotaxis family, CheB/CheR fusion protein